MLAYRNGIIDTNQTFDMATHETIAVIKLRDRGLIPGMSFGETNQFQDSFVVVFDNTYKVSHYKPNLIGDNLNNYLYHSNRNIFSRDSYIKDNN